MSYKKVEAIKQEVENFPNTAFYSMTEENTVVVKNTQTGAVYEIPYEEAENGIVLDGEKAELVKEKEKTSQEQFEENSMNFQETMKKVFSENYDEAVKNLKQMIKTLPDVENEFAWPTEADKKDETVYEGILADKFNKVVEIEKEYKKQKNLFDENGNVIPAKVSVSHYNEAEKEAEEEMKLFEEAVSKWTTFKKALMEDIEKEEVVDELLKNINFEEDIRMTAPKAMVMVKNRIDEDVNVIDITKNVVATWNNIFNEDGLTPSKAMPVIYNFAQKDTERPTFLKFKMGVFTVEDAITMLEELDNAMAHIGDINDEELGFIANQKEILEYMIRTRKISDRVMKNIIQDFNEIFANRAAEDEYIQSQRGFKSREEREIGNIQGKSDVTPNPEGEE